MLFGDFLAPCGTSVRILANAEHLGKRYRTVTALSRENAGQQEKLRTDFSG